MGELIRRFRHVLEVAVLACFCLLAAAPLWAQTAGRSEFVIGDEAYAVIRWDTDSGLPSNIVYGLAQTPDGYLWVATQEGLVRFDGNRFVEIDTRGDDREGAGHTRSIAVDAHGTLWAAVTFIDQAPRVVRRVGEAWVVVEEFDGEQIDWLAPTPDGGMCVLVGAPGPNAYVARWLDGSAARHELPDRWSGFTVLGSRSGACWVGTQSGAVVRIDGDEMARFELTGAGDAIHSLAEDAEARIWVGTDTGVYVRDGDSFVPYGKEGPILGLLSTASGHMWAAHSDRSLERLATPGAVTSKARPRLTLPATHLTSLEDAEGNLWFGLTGGGLVQLRRNLLPPAALDPDYDRVNVRIIRPPAPYTADSVLILEYCQVWLMGSDGIRYRRPEWPLDGTSDYPLDGTSEAPGPDCASAAAADSEGSLWILLRGGLARLRDGGKVARFAFPRDARNEVPTGELPSRRRHLIADASGHIWYVHQGVGIVGVTPTGEQTVYPVPPDIPSFDVTSLRAGRDGELWFITRGGFGRFSAGAFDHWPSSEWFPGARPLDVHVDPDGLAWVTSNTAGVLIVDGEPIARLTRDDGLPDNRIHRIAETDDGHLWMGSPRGLIVASRATVMEYLRGDADFPRFDFVGLSHGAPRFVTPRVMIEKGPDGRMWLFGTDGVNVVDPATLRRHESSPVPIIEEIAADGEPLPLFPTAAAPANREAVVVPAGTLSVAIRYTLPTFVSSELARFRYRLDGQDPTWIDGEGGRRATYSNLQPGEYTFRVRARKNFGPWVEESVAFVVLPLWWQTAWFTVVSVLGLVGLGAALQRARGRATRRRLEELQREIAARKAAETETKELGRRMVTSQEDDRARVGRELHDDISQRVHAAAIGVDLVIRRGGASPDEVRQLQKAMGQLDAVARDARKLSHQLHPAALDLAGLVVALEGFCADFQSTTAAAVSVSLPDSVPESTTEESALCLYRITQEALRNIAKHAEATEVEVELTVEPDGLRLRIRDDGVGFDPEERASGLGLASMRERARLLDGTLTLDAQPGGGTEVTVVLPGHRRGQ